MLRKEAGRAERWECAAQALTTVPPTHAMKPSKPQSFLLQGFFASGFEVVVSIAAVDDMVVCYLK